MEELYHYLMLTEEAMKANMTPEERKDYQKFLWGNANLAD